MIPASEKLESSDCPRKTCLVQKQAGHHLVDGAPLEEREIKVVYRSSEFVFGFPANFGSEFTNALDFYKNG
jgi:hypothetical protein